MNFDELVCWATKLKPIAEAFVLFTAPFAAVWTVWTYHHSVKLERAKWIKDVYEKFYEQNEMKKVRNLLDGADLQQVHSMVTKEDPAFTDYLNFFEFLGYLWESHQISSAEILGLFDYYLRNLRKDEKIASYIADPAKGFEKLQKLLKMVEDISSR
jgi:hypothetical protein